MAPRKRSSEGEAAPPTRVTRSSSGRLKRHVSRSSGPAPPLPKIKKRSSKKAKVGSSSAGEEVVSSEAVTETALSEGKAIVIEHCKQCNSFKTRAVQVKEGLESGIPGITVLINPEKPRRGCFEIREEGGEKFISLLDMPRPFQPMKDLDMDEVISNIIDKIK